MFVRSTLLRSRQKYGQDRIETIEIGPELYPDLNNDRNVFSCSDRKRSFHLLDRYLSAPISVRITMI